MNRRKIKINSEPPLITNSADETFELGKSLAKVLRRGAVIALYGELGTGKSCLTKGICAGLAVTDEVVSPSFTLINEYKGRYAIYHFDCYRLSSSLELIDIGAEEYFYNNGICIIEWAERVSDILPDDTIHIRLEHIFQNEGDHNGN